MPYKITKYSFEQANKLGVEIKPSVNKNKKIDVFKNGKKISSIGFLGMMDYPNYIIKDGKPVAEERRKLYKLRHKKDLQKVGSNGYYANKILW
jgi:hypothetical protein